MPTYNFTDTITGETHIEFLWVSELDEYLLANPNLTVSPPDTSAFVEPERMGRVKTPDSFREVLRGIKKWYKGSTIDV